MSTPTKVVVATLAGSVALGLYLLVNVLAL